MYPVCHIVLLIVVKAVVTKGGKGEKEKRLLSLVEFMFYGYL